MVKSLNHLTEETDSVASQTRALPPLDAGTMLSTFPESRLSAITAPTDAPKMTARQRENAKTRREKAMDWSYTANHAIYCLLTDLPEIGLKFYFNTNEKFKESFERTTEPFTNALGV